MTTACGRGSARRPHRALAVVDVDARDGSRCRGGRPAGRRPVLAEQLVHLAPHALDVDQQFALPGHRARRLAEQPRRRRLPRPRSRPGRRRPRAACGERMSGSSSSEMWVRTSRPTPAAAATSPASRGAHVAALGERSRVGLGQRRLGEQHVGAAGGRDSSSLGAAAVGAVDDPPAAPAR